MKAFKGKTVFCFPGQLHERPALKDDPLQEDPHFKELLRRASSQTRFDFFNFSFGDEAEGEDFSLQLQISTYFLSMVHFFRLRAAGWNPDIFAEHSMGIYSALAASEAIGFEEGLFITEAVGRLLQREGATHRGAMASIIGLPLQEIQKICQDLNGFQLSIANYNGSMHFVLSGEEGGIEKSISLALSRKAVSATRLAFNTALHSPALHCLREEIMTILQDIKIQPPRVPILNHWTIKPLKREETKDFLSQEIGRPVYWIRCVEKLLQEGFTQFIEVGHEATLTKLMRWVDREADAFSAGDRLAERRM
ncbi:MAG TPA: ACP S-malonyltransferase [Thermodesulfobacteriota bacterium]|nr:ACP S-malonyltransferase [Thermodesulfobacteriota bacterium]